jgi:uncharacterized membrane protein YfcA
VSYLEFSVILVFASVLAGALGAALGLGGGAVIVPLLTLGFGLSIHQSIGASVVAVVATSVGAAIAYVRDEKVNLRLAFFLEVATATGALVGAVVAVFLPERALQVMFGALLVLVAAQLFLRGKGTQQAALPSKKGVKRLAMEHHFTDEATGQKVAYEPRNRIAGFAGMIAAGLASALFGVGGGTVKVPVMDVLMGVPVKASTATSNFMIGVTAAASAIVYFQKGYVNPYVAGPIAVGIVAGSVLGARIANRASANALRAVFAVVLVGVGVEMILGLH